MNRVTLALSRLGLAVLVVFLASCIATEKERGVENTWRDPDVPTFEAGVSTREDVVAALGPPSQILDLHQGLVFYYLLEQAKSRGAVFLVYNRVRTDVRYDRAVFFFDDQGLLTEHAYSAEEAR